jgi:DUF1707 SHOCT-like domain
MANESHLRIGDREREQAAERLSGHAAAGRLSVEELERRLDLVHRAEFGRDLAAVETDLPGRHQPVGWNKPTGWLPHGARRLLVPLALALLAVGVLASILVQRPLVPLFVLSAVLLWRGVIPVRRSHRWI